MARRTEVYPTPERRVRQMTRLEVILHLSAAMKLDMFERNGEIHLRMPPYLRQPEEDRWGEYMSNGVWKPDSMADDGDFCGVLQWITSYNFDVHFNQTEFGLHCKLFQNDRQERYPGVKGSNLADALCRACVLVHLLGGIREETKHVAPSA